MVPVDVQLNELRLTCNPSAIPMEPPPTWMVPADVKLNELRLTCNPSAIPMEPLRRRWFQLMSS